MKLSNLNRLVFTVLMWLATSGTQCVLFLQLGKRVLGVGLLLLAVTQLAVLLNSFRSCFTDNTKGFKQVRDPDSLLRSSYIKNAGYLFITIVFESYLIGRSELAGVLGSFVFEVWIGHVALIGSGIVRYWSLSLARSIVSPDP